MKERFFPHRGNAEVVRQDLLREQSIDVSLRLAEARNAAFANLQQARPAGEPLAEKRHGQGVPTVEDAAEVLEQQRRGRRKYQARAALAAQSARPKLSGRSLLLRF